MYYICIIYVLDLYYIWKNHINARFSWVLLGFLASAAILVWLLLAFVGFFGVRGDPCMALLGFLASAAILVLSRARYTEPHAPLLGALLVDEYFILNQILRNVSFFMHFVNISGVIFALISKLF